MFFNAFFSSSKAPIITRIVTFFLCHLFSTTISRSLFFDIFSSSAYETLLKQGFSYLSVHMSFFPFVVIVIIKVMNNYVNLSHD